ELHVADAELVEQHLAQHGAKLFLIHVDADLLRDGGARLGRGGLAVAAGPARHRLAAQRPLEGGADGLVARAGGRVLERRGPAAEATLARGRAVRGGAQPDEEAARPTAPVELPFHRAEPTTEGAGRARGRGRRGLVAAGRRAQAAPMQPAALKASLDALLAGQD